MGHFKKIILPGGSFEAAGASKTLADWGRMGAFRRSLHAHHCSSRDAILPRAGWRSSIVLLQVLQIEGHRWWYSSGCSKSLVIRVTMFRATVEGGAVKAV